MSGVDVLAVMDDIERGMRHVSAVLADDMQKARAAVAELIEADQQVDEAEAEFAKYPGNGSALWLKNSKERRLAALARVTGGAE